MKFIGLLVLHAICLYFLRLLWKDKNEAIKRGRALTKAGLVSLKKSPRLFYFSVWVDFMILLMLYVALIVFSIFLLSP
jgi:hypothetical protein